MRRPGAGIARRPGARQVPGSRTASGPDFLALYSANPIDVDNSTLDAETISSGSVDPEFYSGPWHMTLESDVASSELVFRYIWALDASNHMYFQNTSGGVRLRLAGVNYNWFGVTYSASDTLQVSFDPDSALARIRVNGGSWSDVTIADVTMPTLDLIVGKSHLDTLPFDGRIHQPISGNP